MKFTSLSDPEDVADRWNRAFHALSQEPRRKLLISLINKPASEWVSLPDAALSSHYSGNREDLRIELCHQHLPLLKEKGYVDWRDSPFGAKKGPRFEEIEAIIRAIMTFGDALSDQLITDCQTLEERIYE